MLLIYKICFTINEKGNQSLFTFVLAKSCSKVFEEGSEKERPFNSCFKAIR